MDHNVSAADRYFSDQESAHEAACYAAAQKAGVASQEAADNCDDGECCCPECPWRTTAGKWREQTGLIRMPLGPADWTMTPNC